VAIWRRVWDLDIYLVLGYVALWQRWGRRSPAVYLALQK